VRAKSKAETEAARLASKAAAEAEERHAADAAAAETALQAAIKVAEKHSNDGRTEEACKRVVEALKRHGADYRNCRMRGS
jgi:phosphotransacetylase